MAINGVHLKDQASTDRDVYPEEEIKEKSYIGIPSKAETPLFKPYLESADFCP